MTTLKQIGSFFNKFFVVCAFLILPFASIGQTTDTVIQVGQEEQIIFEESTVVRPERLNSAAPKIDFSQKTKTKNPKVATWLSVALPGAGQVYNGHWYKVPIIYAGAATLVYFYRINVDERNIYKEEYIRRLNNDPANLPNPDFSRYSDANIRYIRDYYQRNIELVLILSGVLYVLNIIDACVFAHLYSFDVSDNLSVKIRPFANPMENYRGPGLPMNAGLKLSFTLK